jgi:hypothetical protein
MYIEGKKKVRFLLSAKQFSPGGTLYISSSEDFPFIDSVPRKGYFARMQRQKDQSYMLFLNHCHLCDYRLGFFCCGRSEQEREVVVRISHFYQRYQAINLDYKCIKVQLPAISKSGKRKIWCQRAFGNAFTGSSGKGTIESCIKELDANSVFCFKNELPDWNADLNSLVIHFQGNRILTPSVRNFLLIWAKDDNSSVISRSSSRSISSLQTRSDTTASSGEKPSEVRTKRSSSDFVIGNTASAPSSPRVQNTMEFPASRTSPSVDSPKLRGRANSANTYKPLRRISSTNEKAKDPHSEAVLQFGKTSATRFTLDFRYPLSPLQAFGIALASFASESNSSQSSSHSEG